MPDWKSLFAARGRSGRARYWAIFVPTTVVALGANFIMISLAFARPGPRWIVGGLVVALLATCAVISVCNTTKRLHDLGRSGWWQVAPIAASLATHEGALAFLGAAASWGVMAGAALPFAFAVVVGAIPGGPGPNRFGDPPTRPPMPALAG